MEELVDKLTCEKVTTMTWSPLAEFCWAMTVATLSTSVIFNPLLTLYIVRSSPVISCVRPSSNVIVTVTPIEADIPIKVAASDSLVSCADEGVIETSTGLGSVTLIDTV